MPDRALKLKFLRLLRKIPKGRVTTYKIIGQQVGIGPRQAGYFLRTNERPDLYPCYKVVKSDGGIGGYGGSAARKIAKKIRLLRGDGIEMEKGKLQDFEELVWRFKK